MKNYKKHFIDYQNTLGEIDFNLIASKASEILSLFDDTNKREDHPITYQKKNLSKVYLHSIGTIQPTDKGMLSEIRQLIRNIRD